MPCTNLPFIVTNNCFFGSGCLIHRRFLQFFSFQHLNYINNNLWIKWYKKLLEETPLVMEYVQKDEVPSFKWLQLLFDLNKNIFWFRYNCRVIFKTTKHNCWMINFLAGSNVSTDCGFINLSLSVKQYLYEFSKDIHNTDTCKIYSVFWRNTNGFCSTILYVFHPSS